MVGDPVSQSSKRDGFCQKQSLIPQTGTVHPLQLDSTSDSFQVGQRSFRNRELKGPPDNAARDPEAGSSAPVADLWTKYSEVVFFAFLFEEHC
jgi:hypothetical protein